jgi:hypothetical protein
MAEVQADEPREHELSADCWCEPEVVSVEDNYRTPEEQAALYAKWHEREGDS